jgi:hypothetical protein
MNGRYLLGKAPAIRPASRGPCEPRRACASMRRTIAAQALAQTGGIPAVIKKRGRGRPANAQGTAAGAASLSYCQGLVSGIASLLTYPARHVVPATDCHFVLVQLDTGRSCRDEEKTGAAAAPASRWATVVPKHHSGAADSTRRPPSRLGGARGSQRSDRRGHSKCGWDHHSRRRDIQELWRLCDGSEATRAIKRASR